MLAALPFLADEDSSFGVVLACMFLLVIVAGGAYAVIWLRRRFWGAEKDSVPMVGFTLGDWRRLHKSGQISTEEFEQAKEKIIAAARRAAERDATPVKPGPGPLPPDGQ